jgi:hypothetical protein
LQLADLALRERMDAGSSIPVVSFLPQDSAAARQMMEEALDRLRPDDTLGAGLSAGVLQRTLVGERAFSPDS